MTTICLIFIGVMLGVSIGVPLGCAIMTAGNYGKAEDESLAELSKWSGP